MKILMSAYACEPGKGSEPGVGWNVACTVARHHEVWVITRASNRAVIEAELAEHPVSNLHFAFYDLPEWSRFWKRKNRGVLLYYYLWQLGIYPLAKKLHEQHRFDLIHHVTFVKYWSPSFLARLPLPFVWGPVGGGESAPRAFWPTFSVRGQVYEAFREAARWLGERDPSTRHTARRSALTSVATPETASRVKALGAVSPRLFSAIGLSAAELTALERGSPPPNCPLKFISLGTLLHWKGFHLSLAAFAQANIPEAEYWLVGDGPERARLERLAAQTGMGERVRFWGQLPREQALKKLAECHVFVHPSLHDSGGWVCLEAMASGRPVICLDVGGPAEQVTACTGIKVAAVNPEQAVADLATAMKRLAEDEGLREHMGAAGRKRVKEHYLWEVKSVRLSDLYHEAVENFS